MAARLRHLPEPPPSFPAVPAWARAGISEKVTKNGGFLAGAALAALHPIARQNHPLGRLWRQRLALGCAAALARHRGRGEDEGALRDAFYLTRPGDDVGPAGRLLQAWRDLAACGGQTDRWPTCFATSLELPAAAADELLQRAQALAGGITDPMSAVAEILATSLRLIPRNDLPALWLADAVLAQRLGWPAPVPLLARHLPRSAFGNMTPGAGSDRALISACTDAYAAAAVAAADLYADLSRRATRLLAVAPKLRSRDADDVVLALISEDARAAEAGRTTSDRSSRRLLERLVALGAARELTGRTTFRLYGL